MPVFTYTVQFRLSGKALLIVWWLNKESCSRLNCFNQKLERSPIAHIFMQFRAMETLRNLLLFLPNAAQMVLKCAQLLRKHGDDTKSIEIMKYCINLAIFPSQIPLRFIMKCLHLFLAIRSPLIGACANFQVKECMLICNVRMIYLN